MVCIPPFEFQKNLKSSTYVPRSYAVPTEVGKVGTESPSFIEPITSRKDGIQAMFSKQRQNSPTKSQPTTASPTKRRREASISLSPEKVDHPSSASSQATTVGGSPQRKRLRSNDKDVDKLNEPDEVCLPLTDSCAACSGFKLIKFFSQKLAQDTLKNGPRKIPKSLPRLQRHHLRKRQPRLRGVFYPQKVRC